jgi:hypothetical protein
VKAIALLSLFLISTASLAQDERFYRKIFTGELTDKTQEAIQYKVIVRSPRYEIDLNQDKIMETIRVEKKDGFDFFLIFDQFGREIFNKRLPAIGANSRLLKVDLKSITKKVNTLILHFYEGAIDSTKFEATAKLFFVTFDKNDLKKIKFFNGPHFFHEKEKGSQYFNRRYSVNTIDYNNDGSREISVSYNKISRIYFYTSTGEWKML